jgi:N-acetylmuramoyl-L-alanine amidase
MMFGTYVTPGKRSPSVPPGIYEGEFSRQMAKRIKDEYDYDPRSTGRCEILNPGTCNVNQQTRYETINIICKRTPDTALIAIHANAAPTRGYSAANGFGVFHSRRASRNSRRLARLLKDHWKVVNIRIRGVKKANHWITTRTNCPAILSECGFMTHRGEAELLGNPFHQREVASSHVEAMLAYERGER